MERNRLAKIGFILLGAGVVFAAAFAAPHRASRPIASRKASFGTRVVPDGQPVSYPDHRPAARYRLEARDQGVVFKHGRGPERCDYLGARDVWVWKYKKTYYMHYDGAGPRGWRACLATSHDLANWTPHGPVLDSSRISCPTPSSSPRPATLL